MEEEEEEGQEKKMDNEVIKRFYQVRQRKLMQLGVVTLGVRCQWPNAPMMKRVLSVNLGPGVGRNDWLEGAVSCLKQKRDCSQVEDDSGEGDVMDWLEDGEAMGRCHQEGGGGDQDEEDGRKELTS